MSLTYDFFREYFQDCCMRANTLTATYLVLTNVTKSSWSFLASLLKIAAAVCMQIMSTVLFHKVALGGWMSNASKVILFGDLSKSSHQITVSTEHPPTFECYGRAYTAAEYYNAAQHLCHWGAHTSHYWIACKNHHHLAQDRRSYVGLCSQILLRMLYQWLKAIK